MEKSTRHGSLFVLAFGIMAVLNYGFSVALSWYLTPAEFGVLGVAQALLLLAALVVGSGFGWKTARDIASTGLEGAGRRFRAAWLANSLFGASLALGLWLAYSAGWLSLGPDYRLIVPLVGVSTWLLAMRAVVNGAAQGLHKFAPMALNQVAEGVVKVGAGLWLVALGAGVAGVMAGFALGAAFALGHSLWIVRHSGLWRGRGWRAPGTVRATLPLFVGMLGPALILNLDILGLKLLSPAASGDELAGYYQAAIILARTPVFIARSLTVVFFAYVAGESAGPQQQTGTAARLWSRALLPAGLGLLLAPQVILGLFFPPAYQAAVPALRWAAVGGVLLALVTLLTGIAQAAHHSRLSARVSGAATLAQVLTLLWFVPRWGIAGAAFSLVVAGTVALVGLLPAFWPRQMPAPSAWLKGTLPYLVLVLALLWQPGGNRLLSLAWLGGAGSLYLLTLALCCYFPWRACFARRAHKTPSGTLVS